MKKLGYVRLTDHGLIIGQDGIARPASQPLPAYSFMFPNSQSGHYPAPAQGSSQMMQSHTPLSEALHDLDMLPTRDLPERQKFLHGDEMATMAMEAPAFRMPPNRRPLKSNK